MTARRLYNEDQIIAALNEASRKHGILPATGTFLKELRGRGEPVLFTKDELLAVAATVAEKWMVYGIFAMLGTETASESTLISRSRGANLGGNMEIMIRLAKAKKDENFQPGDVVRDAAGRWYQRRKDGGSHSWCTFGNNGVMAEDWPERPLEKMG